MNRGREGAGRPMKRGLDHVDAFAEVQRLLPTARLIVAGSHEPEYRRAMVRRAGTLPGNAVEFRGRVDQEEKQTLLEQAHVLLAAHFRAQKVRRQVERDRVEALQRGSFPR